MIQFISYQAAINELQLSFKLMEIKETEQVAKFKLLIKQWQQLTNRFDKGESPSTIQNLFLTAKGIKAIPTCFKCLTSLRELYLANNQITKIENLEKLTSLRVLDLSRNLSNIRDQLNNQTQNNFQPFNNELLQFSISQQTLFKQIDYNLDGNKIETIEGILNIQILNLTVLRLDNNKISNFGALRRAHLPLLQAFTIDNNKTDQHNTFNEFKSQRLNDFWFDQFTDKSSILIFKMELFMESWLAKEKQRIWKQRSKRTQNVIDY